MVRTPLLYTSSRMYQRQESAPTSSRTYLHARADIYMFSHYCWQLCNCKLFANCSSQRVTLHAPISYIFVIVQHSRLMSSCNTKDHQFHASLLWQAHSTHARNANIASFKKLQICSQSLLCTLVHYVNATLTSPGTQMISKSCEERLLVAHSTAPRCRAVTAPDKTSQTGSLGRNGVWAI